VRRELILDSRITQADNQFHAISLLARALGSRAPRSRHSLSANPSAGSKLVAQTLCEAISCPSSQPFRLTLPLASPSGSSPSVSCLPFLITSGSAEPLRHPHCLRSRNHFFLTVMVQSSGSHRLGTSLRIVRQILHAHSTPNTRWLISTSIFFGMSLQALNLDLTRQLLENAPSVFTPAASP